MNIFNAFYAIIVIFIALYALVKGFKIGLSHQIASLLGLAFGAVAARVLLPQFYTDFLWVTTFSQAHEFNDLSINLSCAVVIFTVVFLFFSLFSPIFNFAFGIFEVGIINQLAGAFFSLVKYLLWVSIALNLLLCFSSKSGLLYYEKSNDGNLIGAVMAICPAILGCFGAEDFALQNQLREAKYISCLDSMSQKNLFEQQVITCNFTPRHNVIFTESQNSYTFSS